MLGWLSSPRLQNCYSNLCNTEAQQSSYCRICSSAQKERQFRSQPKRSLAHPLLGALFQKWKCQRNLNCSIWIWEDQDYNNQRWKGGAIGVSSRKSRTEETLFTHYLSKTCHKGLKSAEREEDRFAVYVSGLCNRREETHQRASLPYACGTLCTSLLV